MRLGILVSIIFLLQCRLVLAVQCVDLLGQNTESQSLAVQQVLNQFEFPTEADVLISQPQLRQAIYEAFGGKDYYTGEPMSFEEMRIDHIVPKSKGGPDNIFNYVPTTSRINSRKSAAFDPLAAVPLLFIVRTSFAPKVLKHYQEARSRIAVERQERINRRTAAPAKVKPVKTQKKPSIVSQEVSLRNMTPEGRKSLILIKKYVDENPEMLQKGEIFISAEEVNRIQLEHPDFEVKAAFQVLFDFVDVFSDGRTEDFGGSRIFSGVRTAKPITENTQSVSSPEGPDGFRSLFEDSPFYNMLREERGHILRLSGVFDSFLIDSSTEEFSRLLDSETIPMDYFVNPVAIKLKPQSAATVNLFKLMTRFASPSEADGGYYIRIDEAIDAGFGDMKIDLLALSDDPHTLYGRFGKPSVREQFFWVLSSLSFTGVGETPVLLEDFSRIEFRMSDSVYNWLTKSDFDAIETIFSRVNLNGDVELPDSVSPIYN